MEESRRRRTNEKFNWDSDNGLRGLELFARIVA
jgi:hypothetical protein